MSIIECFEREENKVILSINSGLDVKAYRYPFDWNCGDENYAELLKNKLNEQLREYKAKIARDPFHYLKPREITELKRRLKDWNGSTGYWK